MRPPPLALTTLLLALAGSMAAAQAPRDDPDSPDYLKEQRPQGRKRQSQSAEQSPQGQGSGRRRVAIPEEPKPRPMPEPRAILAIDDAINDLAIQPDGLLLAVAAGAETLVTTGPGNAQVWDLTTSPPGKTAAVPGHLNFVVQSVAFSAKGSLLAVGDDAGGLVLWDGMKRAARAGVDVDWREGVAPRHDRDRTGAVAGLAFTPDGKSVAFLPSIAGRVRVHDADDGRERRYWKTRDGYRALALAFDGEHPLVLVEPEVGPVLQEADAFGGDGKERARDLVVWDVDEGRPRSTIKTEKPIGRLAFSADGRRLAYLDPTDPHEVRPGPRVVTIRDAGPGEARFTHRLPSEPADLAFDGGARLAVSVDDRVILLDARDARPLKELRAPGRPLGRVAFGDQDGVLAVAADREVILWDVSGFLPGPEPFVEPVGPPAPPDPNGPTDRPR